MAASWGKRRKQRGTQHITPGERGRRPGLESQEQRVPTEQRSVQRPNAEFSDRLGSQNKGKE